MAQSAVMLFGPTASGKTGVAIELAQALNGVIINADSRQIYQDMPILTAVPSPEEQAAAPHTLFEILTPDTPFSVGDYRARAHQKAEEVRAEGKLPIFVGGTGLYLDVLLRALSPVPTIPETVLQTLKNELETRGREALVEELVACDPTWAAKISAADTQRLLRGLSVYRSTGKPLTYWQQQPREGALPYQFTCCALHRPREEMRARIAQRFDLMMQAGLLNEIKALLQKGYALDLPALKSLGVKEFAAYLAGDMSFEEAKQTYITQQNQYAKRQVTWLKNNYPAQYVYEKPNTENVLKDITPHL